MMRVAFILILLLSACGESKQEKWFRWLRTHEWYCKQPEKRDWLLKCLQSLPPHSFGGKNDSDLAYLCKREAKQSFCYWRPGTSRRTSWNEE